MARWQTTARVITAAAAIVFAVVVALAFKRRTPTVVSTPAPQSDPRAVIESASGRTFRINREHEEIRIEYDKLLSYADGSSKMAGIKVITDRAGGRTFTMTGNEGVVGQNESTVALSGKVHVEATDGLDLRTEQATYTEADGVVRSAGPVDFVRGRSSGHGVGFTYDKRQDILTILDQAVVRVAADKGGSGAMDLTAGGAEFRRGEHLVRFERAMHAVRTGQTIDADAAVAHLTEDDKLEKLELRGHSRVGGTPGTAGALQALSANDADLQYAPDGEALERALLAGEAAITLAGASAQTGRQIAAGTVTIVLAPDGTTPTALTAKDMVHLTLPGEADGTSRTIAADLMESTGDAKRGLTTARFTGHIQFRERGNGIDRAASAGALDLALAPGFGTVEEARFARGVTFEEGHMAATAALARYLVTKGVVELTGSEPGFEVPHVITEQITVDAVRTDLTLAGPQVRAAGTVKSVLQPARAPAKGAKADRRRPSMLKQDQPVTVTANELNYDGTASRAVYTGGAQLWQGQTTIKGGTLTIDDKSGDLTASGAVSTVVMLFQQNQDGKRERVRSTATSKDFKYVEQDRRAIYTGQAHMNGTEGDLQSPRIELHLKPSGDEIERLEAYESVALLENRRKTKGTRLTYFSADERYVASGAPVTVLDECGRETTGRTLTFYRTADRIVVDGNEQARTHTKGVSTCP